MHRNATLLTLVLSIGALAPATAAELTPVEPGSSVDVALGASADVVGVEGTASAVVDEGTAPLDATLGLAASVDVETGPAPETFAEGTPSAPLSRGDGASPTAWVAEAAAPAAGVTLFALLLGALALGLDGLRLAQLRLTGALGRALRFVAGPALAAIPLFSRIERGQVMDNPVRARVHEIIATEPGLSLSQVSLRAGIAWGTAVHHLRRLEAHGVVVSQSQHPHRRYFIANTPAAAQRASMAVVMHPTARRIAEFVAQTPGTDQSGICQALGLKNPAASKHLGRFEADGLVLSQRTGRSRHYHATGGLHSALLLLEPSRAAPMVAPTRMLATQSQGA